MIPTIKTVALVGALVLLVVLVVLPWILFKKKGLIKPWLAGSMVIIVRDLVIFGPLMSGWMSGNPQVELFFNETVGGVLIYSLLLVLAHLVIRALILKGILKRPEDAHQDEELWTMGVGQAALAGIFGIGILFLQNILIIQSINNQSIYDMGLDLVEVNTLIQHLQSLSVLSILSSAFSVVFMAVVFAGSTWILGQALRLKRWLLIAVSILLELLYYGTIRLAYLNGLSEVWVFILQLVVAIFTLVYIQNIYRRRNHERF